MTTVILHYNVVCGYFVVMLYSNKIDGIFFQFYLGCGFAEHVYLFILHASAILAVTDPSVCLLVTCWHCGKTTETNIMQSSSVIAQGL